MPWKLKATQHRRIDKQNGFALFEALISLLVIALGLLAIVGVQLRTLSDTQTAVKRSQAVDLVNQLAERIRTNPSSINNASSYLIALDATPNIPKDCSSTACNASERATYDVNTWLSDVEKVMPLGDAAVFLPADYPTGYTGKVTQLGVLISWRISDKTKSDGSSDTEYLSPFKVNTGSESISCPENRICHLQFIPLNTRCTPYSKSGTDKFYCAG